MLRSLEFTLCVDAGIKSINLSGIERVLQSGQRVGRQVISPLGIREDPENAKTTFIVWG